MNYPNYISVQFGKLILATVLTCVFLLSISPVKASESLVSDNIIEIVRSNLVDKQVISIGKYTIVLNHTPEEFKEIMLNKALMKSSSSDNLYRSLGLNTDAESHHKTLKKYFAGINQRYFSESPAFAMHKINAMYLDVPRISHDKDFNVHKHYNKLQKQTNIVTTSINTATPTIRPEIDRFDDFLYNLSTEELMDTSTEILIQKFNDLNPPLPTIPDIANLQSKLLDIRSKIAKINKVFDDWFWFLQPKLYQPTLTLKQISDNNMNIDWIYLHELSHLLSEQNPPISFSFRSSDQRSLLREMHSDVFAAIMLNYEKKTDIYKKIDSIIYSRALKNADSKHFTIAPLMVLKILMSNKNYQHRSVSHKQKKLIIKSIMDSTTNHLEDIIKIGDNMDAFNQKGSATQLKEIVRLILIDLSKNSALL